MKMNNKVSYVLMLLLFLSACSVGPKLSVVSIAHYYRGGDFTVPKILLWHSSDTMSVLEIQVDFNDFTYEEAEDTQKRHAEAIIQYRLYKSYQDKQTIDSSTVRITDTVGLISSVAPVDTVAFYLPALRGKNYVARIDVTDVIGNASTYFFVEVPKMKKNNQFDYRVFNKDGSVKNDSYIDLNDIFYIDVPVDSGSIFVRYYNRDFPVALPPFANQDPLSFHYTADSLFQINVANGRTPLLNFIDEGFYQFQDDTTQKTGVTLFNFYEGFPDVVNIDELLNPLKYITTSKEFAGLEENPDKKMAIDQFWLKNAGNPLRAKSMISKYYGRVRGSFNKYFSSFIEGWKTDRGLIYIVFGEPKIVYRSDTFEEWIYGEEGNSNSLRFQFVKIENPFSDNDYVLVKSLTYKEKWYDAVSGWRR